AESEARELQAAARARAVRLLFVNASRPSEFETAFADLVQQRADALVVSSAVSLLTDPDQIVALAARHAVPAIYAWRRSMAVGGLMSYAMNLADTWRQAGVYTGRILKGEKPADLPVLVSVRKHFESFESFVIQSGDLIRERHHRCGRRRTAGVTTAANCDIRVT